jgi:selenocysteine lyase/cysteine desulfurase
MTVTGSPMVRAVRRLRSSEFAWTAEATYLNNASIGPLPERTRRVLDDFSAQRTAPYRLSDRELHEMLGTARKTIARLLNAEVEEVALCPNTSLGLSIAAGALPLERGDTVLLSDREFPSNVYPWLRLRERGMAVEVAPTTDLGWPNEEYLLERLRDPAVRVLAISFVQFSNGFRADLTRIGERCRANGTYLVVDGIQGVGQCPLDVRSVPVDMLASGGQKWLLSPWGSGFLYVRRDLVARLDPPVLGWMSFEGTDDFTHLTEYDTTLRADARRFEVATLPFQDMLGMAESVNLLLDIGIEPIRAYLETLRRPLFDAAARGDIEVISPMDGVHESAIVCVRLPHLAEAYHRLRQAGVVCVLREGAIRLSPHCYNTVAEMEKVVELLRGK